MSIQRVIYASGNVTVTPVMLEVGDTSYQIRNITSVSTKKVLVEKGEPNGVWLIAGVVTTVLGIMAIMVGGIILIAIGLLFVAIALKKRGEVKYEYDLFITSSAGELKALTRPTLEEVQRISYAIQEAMAER